jgi:hypothetical protein
MIAIDLFNMMGSCKVREVQRYKGVEHLMLHRWIRVRLKVLDRRKIKLAECDFKKNHQFAPPIAKMHSRKSPTHQLSAFCCKLSASRNPPNTLPVKT